MIGPKQVLLPVSGVEDHRAGVEFAVQEARRRQCGIHVVHVTVPVLPGFPVGSEVGLVGDELQNLGAAAVERAANATERALGDADLPVTSELLHGGVVPALVECSRRASVVVLTRGHVRATRRLTTLKTAHGVAARAHAPVALVPHDWDADRPGTAVVVGVGDEGESRQVVRAGLELARDRGAAAELLHGWWYSDAFDDLVFAGEQGIEETRQQRARLEAQVAPLLTDFPEVDATLVVTHGRPADVLVTASDRAGIVVVGRHHPLLPFGSHLGPVTRVVLREAACPVLVVSSSESAD